MSHLHCSLYLPTYRVPTDAYAQLSFVILPPSSNACPTNARLSRIKWGAFPHLGLYIHDDDTYQRLALHLAKAICSTRGGRESIWVYAPSQGRLSMYMTHHLGVIKPNPHEPPLSLPQMQQTEVSTKRRHHPIPDFSKSLCSLRKGLARQLHCK